MSRPYDLDVAELAALAEVWPALLHLAQHQRAPRELLSRWWWTVTGTRRGPEARTAPLPETLAGRARDGLPTWCLHRRGYGVLQGRAAPVHVVYAHRVLDVDGRPPPVELSALATRLLAVGDVVILSG